MNLVGGIKLIQSFGAEASETEKITSLTDHIMSVNLKAIDLKTKFFPIIRITATMNQAIILTGGCYFFIQGDLTIGAILAYRGYARFFNQPINNLSMTSDMLQRASAASERLYNVSPLFSPSSPLRLP